MSSIITAVFKATIGLLVNKARDTAAEKLTQGDITDQQFRSIIVREIDDIKSKLDGLATKDLLASISFFKEGIQLLYEVFDEARLEREKTSALTEQAAAATACVAQTFPLTKGMRKLKLTDLNESAERALSNAKERFKEARREATRAFANTALSTSDRLLAMQYRVMATLLETVDNPAEALSACRVCIEELHDLPVVQNSFKVELKKGLRSMFSKDGRREIISTVCHINRVTYVVTIMVRFGKDWLSTWPCICSAEEEVHPLCDERVFKVLETRGMEHCCVKLREFGQEGEEEHRLRHPVGIASNSLGQFIVKDSTDSSIKVFENSGRFSYNLPPDNSQNDTILTPRYGCQVATDMNDNIYVLALPGESYNIDNNVFMLPKFNKPSVVYVFDCNCRLLHKFSLKEEFGLVGPYPSLTVNDKNKVLVLRRPRYSQRKPILEVYQTDGQFVGCFGDGILKIPGAIAAANDGRTLVTDYYSSCVHLFSEHGEHILKLTEMKEYAWPFFAEFHWPSEHVVVAGLCEQTKKDLHLLIYTKDGEITSRNKYSVEDIVCLKGLTVTVEGYIGVLAKFGSEDSGYYKVLVM